MRLAARSTERELLDEPGLRDGDLRRNLEEMAMLNRLPGGVAASVRAVRALLPAPERRPVLDVGTGLGDFARRLRRRSAVPVIVADHSPAVLATARDHLATLDDVDLIEADARELPLADGSVSVAHASLLLHHLDPEDAVTVLREMRRVAVRGVVVNDLRRSRLAFVMAAAPILALAREHTTRHDGLVSARRAYTVGELDDLAAIAGLRPIARTPTWWPRVTTTYR